MLNPLKLSLLVNFNRNSRIYLCKNLEKIVYTRLQLKLDEYQLNKKD